MKKKKKPASNPHSAKCLHSPWDENAYRQTGFAARVQGFWDHEVDHSFPRWISRPARSCVFVLFFFFFLKTQKTLISLFGDAKSFPVKKTPLYSPSPRAPARFICVCGERCFGVLLVCVMRERERERSWEWEEGGGALKELVYLFLVIYEKLSLSLASKVVYGHLFSLSSLLLSLSALFSLTMRKKIKKKTVH